MTFRIMVVADTPLGRFVGCPHPEPCRTIEELESTHCGLTTMIASSKAFALYQSDGSKRILGPALVSNSTFDITDNRDEIQP